MCHGEKGKKNYRFTEKAGNNKIFFSSIPSGGKSNALCLFNSHGDGFRFDVHSPVPTNITSYVLPPGVFICGSTAICVKRYL